MTNTRGYENNTRQVYFKNPLCNEGKMSTSLSPPPSHSSYIQISKSETNLCGGSPTTTYYRPNEENIQLSDKVDKKKVTVQRRTFVQRVRELDVSKREICGAIFGFSLGLIFIPLSLRGLNESLGNVGQFTLALLFTVLGWNMLVFSIFAFKIFSPPKKNIDSSGLENKGANVG